MTIKIGINDEVVEATGEELENVLAIRQAAILEAEAQAEAEAKRAAAESKLAALGLTADDLKALGLG